jgi:hypothetical protein
LLVGVLCVWEWITTPMSWLGDALRAAGVRETMSTLPWKTHMWIEKDKVTVRYGYGAELQTIWPV